MGNIIRKIALTIISIFVGAYENSRDACLCFLGKDRHVYLDKEGGLPPPEKQGRVAVVALWPSSTSLPFTLNLLNGLADNGFFILVVTTRRLSGMIGDVVLANCHNYIERYPIGRDFGSYKMGLTWLRARRLMETSDTLFLGNDSMYYTRSITTTIAEMLSSDSDWIGLFESFERHYHIGSFLQIFRRPVFTSRAFDEFWRHYKVYSSREHTIGRGEVGLSTCISRNGFRPYVHLNSIKIGDVVESYLNADCEGSVKSAIIATMGNMWVQKTAHERAILSVIDYLYSRTDQSRKGARARIVASMMGRAAERRNPTHSVGILCNALFEAPIKRDICYRGTHSIGELVRMAMGFSDSEKDAMLSDLKSKGIVINSGRIERLLAAIGRR